MNTEVYALLNQASQDLLTTYILKLANATKAEDVNKIAIYNSVISCLAPQLFVKNDVN